MRSLILSGACLLAATVSWTAARADEPVTDPLVKWGEQLAKPDRFYLNDRRENEVVKYATPRDLKVCVPTQSRGFIDAPAHNVPVTVTWDQDYTATVTPGNCLTFEAQQVSVRPAERMSSDTSIRGDIETVQSPG